MTPLQWKGTWTNLSSKLFLWFRCLPISSWQWFPLAGDFFLKAWQSLVKSTKVQVLKQSQGDFNTESPLLTFKWLISRTAKYCYYLIPYINVIWYFLLFSENLLRSTKANCWAVNSFNCFPSMLWCYRVFPLNCWPVNSLDCFPRTLRGQNFKIEKG